jgi:hypothetical protein
MPSLTAIPAVPLAAGSLTAMLFNYTAARLYVYSSADSAQPCHTR